MNEQKRREYSAKVERVIDRFRGQYMRKILDALQYDMRSFISDVRQRGMTRATNDLYLNITNNRIMRLLTDLHVDVGLFFGRKAWREINGSVNKGAFGMNEEWTQAIIDWFTQEQFITVSRITETTRQQILAVLSQAQAEGESIEWIARKLNSDELTLWRARLIARTEIAKGAFVGRKVASDASEWETEKEWIAAGDHRTRDGHREVDGETISQQSRFQVRHPKGVDMMEGPGDPDASIANLANCRCSMSTVVKVDERGRPIRKSRISVIQPGDFNRTRTTITI